MIFLGVVAVAARSRGASLAAVYGATVAIYGYALVVTFMALLGIPWQVVNLLLALAAVIAIAAPAVRGHVLSGLRDVGHTVRRSWGAVTIMGVIVLIHVSVAVIKPEISVDGQLYHGSALVNLIQQGSLWGWSVTNEFVYYTDLTMAGGVNLATFTGQARFDDALQIPHLVLLLLVVQWALRARFASAFTRTSLAALIATAPVIWLQPRILYVDLAYGAAIAAIILILALVRTLTVRDLLVLGVLVGSVFATKPTGILTGILLGVAVIVVAVIRRRGTPLRTTVGAIAIGFGPTLLMAASFYVRNLVQFNNPVYPVELKVGPLTFPGIIDFGVFSAAEKGSGGLFDPLRLISYFGSLGDGMINGITNLDYDPRSGGYGFVPLAVLIIAAVVIASQIIARRASGPVPRTWPAQLVIAAIALPIVAVQPMSYDARYLIGSTVALLVAVLLTAVGHLPRPIELLAGIAALTFAFGQVIWSERTLVSGAGTALELRELSPEWQAATPGNPWGDSYRTGWIPDTECVTIALQTSGGLTRSGMAEGSYFATFPYALYGDQLCNDVMPVTLNGRDADSPANAAAIQRADFAVLYSSDVDEWLEAYPARAECLRPLDEIDADETYTEQTTVLVDTCR